MLSMIQRRDDSDVNFFFFLTSMFCDSQNDLKNFFYMGHVRMYIGMTMRRVYFLYPSYLVSLLI